MILIGSSSHFLPLDTSSYYLSSTEKQGNNQYDNNRAVRRTPVHKIPDVQVSEADNSIALTIDLPGVKDQDVVISEDNYTLSIEAIRKSGDNEVSKYHRKFSLQKKSVQPAGIKGTLIDGVLTVTIPKIPPPEPLDIPPKALDAPPKAHEDAFQFQLDMPGVKLSGLKVTLMGDELTISAERKTGNSSSSNIKRLFVVDEEKVDTAKLEAYLVDGVLTITAPMIKAIEKNVTIRSFAVNKDKHEEDDNRQTDTADEDKNTARTKK